jgi:lysozyme
MLCSKELPQLLEDEGFRSKPYQDTLDVWTIGHGLTFLTEEESRYIVEFFRLPHVEKVLMQQQPWLETAHPEVRKVLINMAYQLGHKGLSGFKGMITALVCLDYHRAADEMIDSRWYRQTPNRAKRLADRIRAIS